MNGLKNVKIIFSVFLLMLLLVIISWCKKYNNNINNAVHVKKIQQENILTWDYKLLHDFVNNYNLSWCSLIKNNLLKETCVFDIKTSLWKIKNTGDCNIFNKKKKECIDYVYMQNFDCDEIQDLNKKEICKDDFYYNKAVKEKKAYYCLYIKDPKIIKYCYSIIKNNNKNYWNWWQNNWSCGNVNIFMKKCKDYDTKCKINKLKIEFSSEPSLQEKEKICKKIWTLDKNEYHSCIDSFYYVKSLQIMDPSICKNIIDESQKKICYKDTYFKKATEYIMPKLCDEIDDKNKQIECKDKVLLNKIARDHVGDMNMCDKMVLSQYKEQCYSIILKNK